METEVGLVYRHPFYTNGAFCSTSSLVDRLMTKLCWWKLCKHDEDTRRFYHFTLSVLVFPFLFFFLFRFTKDNQNWWTGNAVFIEVYSIRAQRTTNLTTTKEKKHLFLYALKMKEKSQNQNDSSHTHSLVRPEWLASIYIHTARSKDFARRSNAIGLFTVRL